MADQVKVTVKVVNFTEKPIGDKGTMLLNIFGQHKDEDGETVEGRFQTFSKPMQEWIKGEVEKAKGDLTLALTYEEERKGDYINKKIVAIEGYTPPAGGGGGKSWEPLDYKARSFSLGYAKDLYIADKITKNDLFSVAQRFADFIEKGIVQDGKTADAKVKPKAEPKEEGQKGEEAPIELAKDEYPF